MYLTDMRKKISRYRLLGINYNVTLSKRGKNGTSPQTTVQIYILFSMGGYGGQRGLQCQEGNNTVQSSICVAGMRCAFISGKQRLCFDFTLRDILCQLMLTCYVVCNKFRNMQR